MIYVCFFVISPTCCFTSLLVCWFGTCLSSISLLSLTSSGEACRGYVTRIMSHVSVELSETASCLVFSRIRHFAPRPPTHTHTHILSEKAGLDGPGALPHRKKALSWGRVWCPVGRKVTRTKMLAKRLETCTFAFSDQDPREIMRESVGGFCISGCICDWSLAWSFVLFCGVGFVNCVCFSTISQAGKEQAGNALVVSQGPALLSGMDCLTLEIMIPLMMLLGVHIYCKWFCLGQWLARRMGPAISSHFGYPLSHLTQ